MSKGQNKEAGMTLQNCRKQEQEAHRLLVGTVHLSEFPMNQILSQI
jgi:hypothetical protein